MQNKILFQGVSGAYSEQAIAEFGATHNIQFLPQGVDSFQDIFDTVVRDGTLAMIPIENSIAGSVIRSYDLLFTHDVEVIGEWKLPIAHVLIGTPDSSLETITKVISHPQALAQCSKFLEAHKYEVVPAADTAGAVQEVSKTNNQQLAAIAGAFASQQYGMKVLAEGIQNRSKNTTRFFLVKKKGMIFDFEKALPAPNKTSLIFETRDIPAALYKSLGGFASNNVNLLKLESHPHPEKEFDYLFYLDFEGSLKDPAVLRAMEELQYFSEEIKILGSYPKKE